MSTPTSPHDTYTSPLAARNASPEMCKIWSPRHKFTTWRKIWLAVAESQHRMSESYVGKDKFPELVSKKQIEDLRSAVQYEITDEEFVLAAKFEQDLRHDVMAHVHCLGEQCPDARPIIHLGCTSQDIVCNADYVVMMNAFHQLNQKLVRVIDALGTAAKQYVDLPTLGFTHYQPAQPVTVGRRAAGWAYDLYLARAEFGNRMFSMLPKGMKGATGTQASFLALFGGDETAVGLFEDQVVSQISSLCHPKSVRRTLNDFDGFIERGAHSDRSVDLAGQTYPRIYDTFVLADLASIASVLHKIATDIRLLSNRKEIDEPFGKNQIGSSAMPYKRNPMKCERICGLTRFVMNLVGNAYDTAATQWLERTLDDSSNRRLSLPEAFLALDGALDLMHTVASGLVVNEAMVRKNLMLELPFMATENILMEAVKAGGDRQDLHEKIRVHSQEAGHRVKQEGLDNDLIDRLKADPDFKSIHHMLTEDQILNPMNFIGRSVEQTERFLKEVVEPLKERFSDELESLGSADRGV